MDKKTEACSSFILELLRTHETQYPNSSVRPPLFVGLNGVQAAGKSFLVSDLEKLLSSEPYHLNVVVLSIDDLYLTQDDQIALRRRHSDNPLLQARGQPSTHDLQLGKCLFDSLRRNRETKIPYYDKSAYGGRGDRLPESLWRVVNHNGQGVDVVIFEGWCVGFRALSNEQLETAWKEAVHLETTGNYQGMLGYHKLEHLRFVNDALRGYEDFTRYFDAFIQLDAQDIRYVYDWRQEQEDCLRISTGRGMTTGQITKFVDMYYSSYELYMSGLRQGIFAPGTNKQLNLVLDKERKMVNSRRL